jgi:glutamate dehydrogenase (NAD(P)+)
MDFRLHALVSDGDTAGARKRYDDSIALPFGPAGFGYMKTGIGVFHVAGAMTERLGMGKQYRVAVQGFGSVGASAAWMFARAGHKVVAVSDAQKSIRSPEGLDIEELWKARNEANVIDTANLPSGNSVGDRDELLFEECDVLVLAAVKDSIHEKNHERIRATAIIEGANIAVTPLAEQSLNGRGVPVMPDMIASGGGIVHAVKVIKNEFNWQDAGKLETQMGEHMSGIALRNFDTAKEKNITIRASVMGGQR